MVLFLSFFFFFDFVLLFMQISFFVLFLYADKFSLQVPSHLVWIVVVMPIQFSKALKCYLDLSCVCATQTPIWDLGSVLKVLLDCLELDPYRHSTGISSKVHVWLYLIILLKLSLSSRPNTFVLPGSHLHFPLVGNWDFNHFVLHFLSMLASDGQRQEDRDHKKPVTPYS